MGLDSQRWTRGKNVSGTGHMDEILRGEPEIGFGADPFNPHKPRPLEVVGGNECCKIESSGDGILPEGARRLRNVGS